MRTGAWRATSSSPPPMKRRAREPSTRAGPNFHYFHYLWNLFHGIGAGAVMNGTGKDDAAVTVDDLIEDMVVLGSPETVAQRISEVRERAPFGTLLTTMLDGSNPAHEVYEQESMRLLATEVAPRVDAPVGAAV